MNNHQRNTTKIKIIITLKGKLNEGNLKGLFTIHGTLNYKYYERFF